MWRVYRRAMLACVLFAFIVNSAQRAAADDHQRQADMRAQLQASFDPASVLGLEATASEAPNLPDLSGIAIKTAGFAIVTVSSLVSIWFWRTGRSSFKGLSGNDAMLQVSDSLTIAPGINIKTLRTGSHQILVGYDRQGLKGMLLLADEFSDLLDAAENGLSTPHTPELNTVGALLGESCDRCVDRRETGGAALRRTWQTTRRADVPMDAGWELNRLTT